MKGENRGSKEGRGGGSLRERKKGIRVIHHGEVSCPGLPSPGSYDRSHCLPHFIIAQPTVIESPQGGRSSWSRRRESERNKREGKKRD